MKGAARRKADVPHKGKSAERRKEVEESRGRSGTPHRGKGAAKRMEEEFVGGTKEES